MLCAHVVERQVSPDGGVRPRLPPPLLVFKRVLNLSGGLVYFVRQCAEKCARRLSPKEQEANGDDARCIAFEVGRRVCIINEFVTGDVCVRGGDAEENGRTWKT